MPKEFYSITSAHDPISLQVELNRILDSISRRLNNITPDGDNTSLAGKKITNLSTGAKPSDAIRLDQAFLVSDLAKRILGTADRILIIANADQTITIDIVESGIDHNLLKNLAVGNVHTQYVLKSGSITQITTRLHSDLQSLDVDDHEQYLLASTVGGRTLFQTNWTDLTDGLETTLHTHSLLSLTDCPTPITDGTYTVGKGAVTDGTITVENGIITAIVEASDT